MILYVHPYPLSDDRRQRLNIAYQQLDPKPEISVKPAEPGCGRVLAFEYPPFVAEVALVSESTTPENLGVAILAASGVVSDPRVVSVERVLSRMLGAPVKEVK